jgi:hypothetical protein
MAYSVVGRAPSRSAQQAGAASDANAIREQARLGLPADVGVEVSNIGPNMFQLTAPSSIHVGA